VDIDYAWTGEQEGQEEEDGGEGEEAGEGESLYLGHNSHDCAQSPTTTPPFDRRAVTAVTPDTTYKPSSSLQHLYLGNSMMFSTRSDYDPRVCLNPCPNFTLGKHRRTVGVYLAGALFALANWTFLDAAVLSSHARFKWDDEPPVHVTFVDWVPGICSLLGFIVINLINKETIRGDDGLNGDSRAAWTVRLWLFIGLALMAGGLAGSVTVLILKYILHHYPPQFTYYGYANVSQNVALMLSAVVLWIAQNTSNEYEYNLTL